MFPNPQDALPLPSRPSVEQYRKLAKDLVRAGCSADPGALTAFSDRWIASLWRASGMAQSRRSADRTAGQHVPVNAQVDAFLLTRGSRPEPDWHWFGEEPRSSGPLSR
jgi:hypothetical protein